jgi:hypothetical protein
VLALLLLDWRQGVGAGISIWDSSADDFRRLLLNRAAEACKKLAHILDYEPSGFARAFADLVGDGRGHVLRQDYTVLEAKLRTVYASEGTSLGAIQASLTVLEQNSNMLLPHTFLRFPFAYEGYVSNICDISDHTLPAIITCLCSGEGSAVRGVLDLAKYIRQDVPSPESFAARRPGRGLRSIGSHASPRFFYRYRRHRTNA